MRSRYISSLAFIDILFNMLIGFVGLFVIAFILINIPASKTDLEPKAEYMIITTWRDNSNNDIDTWVRVPAGIVFFRQRQAGFAHLDKDDLGTVNDTVILANGEELTSEVNREVVALRGYEPGEYVINLHVFAVRDSTPEEVTVEVIKINPHSVIYRKSLNMHDVGEEKTVVRFFMDQDGAISNVNDEPTSIVDQKLIQSMQVEDGEQYGY